MTGKGSITIIIIIIISGNNLHKLYLTTVFELIDGNNTATAEETTQRNVRQAKKSIATII